MQTLRQRLVACTCGYRGNADIFCGGLDVITCSADYGRLLTLPVHVVSLLPMTWRPSCTTLPFQHVQQHSRQKLCGFEQLCCSKSCQPGHISSFYPPFSPLSPSSFSHFPLSTLDCNKVATKSARTCHSGWWLCGTQVVQGPVSGHLSASRAFDADVAVPSRPVAAVLARPPG